MFTAIRMCADGVNCAEYSALYVAVVLAAAFAFHMMWKRNRTRRRVLNSVAMLAVVTAVCDFVWMCVFYRGGAYNNLGLGGTYAMLALLPAALVLASAVVGVVNSMRNRGKS